MWSGKVGKPNALVRTFVVVSWGFTQSTKPSRPSSRSNPPGSMLSPRRAPGHWRLRPSAGMDFLKNTSVLLRDGGTINGIV